jgi:chemotaxis protein CheD
MSATLARPDVFLLPGEVCVQSRPATIRTILGSCVAVCLWSRARRVGGMNHFLLPRPVDGAPLGPRFGTLAMRELVERVSLLADGMERLEAAVVGGARAVGLDSRLGEENVALALDFLGEHGVRVVHRDTGGEQGRRVLCNPAEARLEVTPLRGWAEVVAGGGR